MRNLIVIAFASLFVANAAFAASCTDQAAEKKLAGAAKNSFVTKCEKDAGAAAPVATSSDCEAKALSKDGKPLAGAAKAASIKKCEGASAAPAAAAAPSCESKAIDKNGKPLAGAAKAASIKKCEADAKK
jgi:hypothetical protein